MSIHSYSHSLSLKIPFPPEKAMIKTQPLSIPPQVIPPDKVSPHYVGACPSMRVYNSYRGPWGCFPGIPSDGGQIWGH